VGSSLGGVRTVGARRNFMMRQGYLSVSTWLAQQRTHCTEKAKAAGRGKATVSALKAGLAVLSRKRIAASGMRTRSGPSPPSGSPRR
jgi:hypothetical protein